jgi:hypothetical protein
MVKRLLLRPLTLLHRCFGVVFCLLFAMWFASGIVMHFVPFPAPCESERVASPLPIDLGRVRYRPAQAVDASGIADVTRVRLLERADGPIYIISGYDTVKALRASDLGEAAVRSSDGANVFTHSGERQRHPEIVNVAVAVEISSDQWTLGHEYDRHRPLYRVAFDDPAGTERYVSSVTGEVVLTTTRDQRRWNYIGSIAHWIYPAVLRGHPHLWSALLWWLALLASAAAMLGATVGILRVGFNGSRLQSPYIGWYALHHWLGLICMPFVLTWIISGWLSMDSGWLFSTGGVAPAQIRALAGAPADWQHLPSEELPRLATAAANEVEWFAFGGEIYRRNRIGPEGQQLFSTSKYASAPLADRSFLRSDEVDRALAHIGMPCKASVLIQPGDEYATLSSTPRAPVFRAACGEDWFHIDGANGSVIEQLDGSRRAYRWLFNGLHTLNFPMLMRHPLLRTVLIVVLCGCGFVFSVSGIVIACRRLRSLW